MKKLLIILMCIAVAFSMFTACAKKPKYTVDGTTTSTTEKVKSDNSIKPGRIKKNTYINESVNLKIEPNEKFNVQTFGDLELSDENPNPVVYDYFITNGKKKNVGVIIDTAGEYKSVSKYKEKLEKEAKSDTLKTKKSIKITDNEYDVFTLKSGKKDKVVLVLEKEKTLLIIEFENFDYDSAKEFIDNNFKTAE